MKLRSIYLWSIFCLLLSACSTTTDKPAPTEPTNNNETPIVEEEVKEIPDPIESVNRAIFDFNDTLDIYILEPVAQGYDDVMPTRVKTGVSNFFENIRYPIYLFSDVVQLKFTQAAEHTGRFVVNTTAGVLGLVDVAKHVGLEHHTEDFGTALGYWGTPTGPYLVIPFLGPSNVRDGFGRIVDSFLNPTYYIDDWPTIIGLKVIETVDDRRKLLEAIKLGKESSLDYYSFVKTSYNQVRLNLIYDNNPPPELLEEMGFEPSPESIDLSDPEPEISAGPDAEVEKKE